MRLAAMLRCGDGPCGERLPTVGAALSGSTFPPMSDADAVDEEHEDLVLAMPRRELFAVSGLVTRVEMRVLESLADESWFAAPSTLVDDIESKEVRVALLVERDGWALVSDDGVLLHATPVPPEVTELGEGLASLKKLAHAAADALLDGALAGVQLLGYYNDDGLSETRPYFILVYLAHAEGGDAAAPDAMRWVDKGELADLPLEPASSVVAAAWAAG